MAGMLLQGGASAVAGGAPPLTQSPQAATSATSVSDIAFGPGATTVGGDGGGVLSLFGLSGAQMAFWVPVALVGFAYITYRSLPG
jgi:hypothetical protein